MIRKLDMNKKKIVMEILKIQKASYMVEATLINYYDIPPLKDSISSLMESDEKFYGYVIEDKIVGFISYKLDGSILDIHRVAILPEYFRKGIGKALIEHVESVEDEVKEIIVCTAKNNFPAVKLYMKLGYMVVKDFNTPDGLVLTKFKKVKTKN